MSVSVCPAPPPTHTHIETKVISVYITCNGNNKVIRCRKILSFDQFVKGMKKHFREQTIAFY